MKNVLFVIMILLTLASCADKEKSVTEVQEPITETEEIKEIKIKEIEEPKQRFSQSQLISQDNVILFDEVEEHEEYVMRFSKFAERGEVVSIYLNEDGSIEQKEAIRKTLSSRKMFNFVHIEYEGKSFWVMDFFIAGKNAKKSFLVTEDAFVYDEPQEEAISEEKIKKDTFVALAENGDKYDGFFKCIAFDRTPFGKEVYLKESALSDDEEMKEIALAFTRLNDVFDDIRDEVILNLISQAKSTDTNEFLSYLAEKIYDFPESLPDKIYSALDALLKAKKEAMREEEAFNEFLGELK